MVEDEEAVEVEVEEKDDEEKESCATTPPLDRALISCVLVDQHCGDGDRPKKQ